MKIMLSPAFLFKNLIGVGLSPFLRNILYI